jgi:hypothetical protein
MTSRMDTSTIWVEGDDPNESTMKVADKLATSALKFLHRYCLASMINPFFI